MKRLRCLVVLLSLTVLGCSDEVLIAEHSGTDVRPGEDVLTANKSFPDVLPLPNGFQPEGIVSGRGSTFYVGSLANGAIYRGDFRTGGGGVLAAPPPDRVAVGLAYDARSDLLFVAGGPTGAAYVYEAGTGAPVAAFALSAADAFINDVVVTREAAYFTDSFRPVFYRLPLGPARRLPDPNAVEEIPLGGDFTFVPSNFNSNGIVATPDGKHLVIVNSARGELYRVDPSTGFAALIDLGGATVANGDGLLLEGRRLYVVQNFLNQIAVVQLSPDLLEGAVVETITDPAFRIPTTVAEFGKALYAVNARFDVPPASDTEYEVVRVRKR